MEKLDLGNITKIDIDRLSSDDLNEMCIHIIIHINDIRIQNRIMDMLPSFSDNKMDRKIKADYIDFVTHNNGNPSIYNRHRKDSQFDLCSNQYLDYIEYDALLKIYSYRIRRILYKSFGKRIKRDKSNQCKFCYPCIFGITELSDYKMVDYNKWSINFATHNIYFHGTRGFFMESVSRKYELECYQEYVNYSQEDIFDIFEDVTIGTIGRITGHEGTKYQHKHQFDTKELYRIISHHSIDDFLNSAFEHEKPLLSILQNKHVLLNFDMLISEYIQQPDLKNIANKLLDRDEFEGMGYERIFKNWINQSKKSIFKEH